MINSEGSPAYFRSCGRCPIEANGKNLAPGADAGVAFDDHVAVQNYILVQRDIGPDDAKRADLDPRAEAGPRIDDCRGVHPTHYKGP